MYRLQCKDSRIRESENHLTSKGNKSPTMDPKEMEMYENKGKDNKFNESK
jgi:hypothetical protein